MPWHVTFPQFQALSSALASYPNVLLSPPQRQELRLLSAHNTEKAGEMDERTSLALQSAAAPSAVMTAEDRVLLRALLLQLRPELLKT